MSSGNQGSDDNSPFNAIADLSTLRNHNLTCANDSMEYNARYFFLIFFVSIAYQHKHFMA